MHPVLELMTFQPVAQLLENYDIDNNVGNVDSFENRKGEVKQTLHYSIHSKRICLDSESISLNRLSYL